MEVVKLTLWLPDQQALSKVLAEAYASLNLGNPSRESDGTIRVTLYASPVEAKKIMALNYRYEADVNFGKDVGEPLDTEAIRELSSL